MEIPATIEPEKIGIAGGNAARRKLLDISNMSQQIRPSNVNEKSKHITAVMRPVNLNEKLKNVPVEIKEFIEKLETENKTLINALVERVKITGTEIQRLRAILQKMQQQNYQLAQSNTQKLAELNLCKERLKALEHDLGCKNGLLKAMKLETAVDVCNQEKPRIQSSQIVNAEVQHITCEDTGDEDKVDSETENAKRRRQSKSSRPSKQVQLHDKAEKKRVSVRRQSARLKHDEIKAEEDSFQAGDASSSVHQPSYRESIEENGSLSASQSEDGGSIRSSLNRPSRQAAKKVQSYKEIPINVKMRRTE